MRITCDANVLVRAAISPAGPARAVLELVLEPPHVLVISAEILAEVREVLQYDRLQKQARPTAEQIDTFVALLAQAADQVLIEQPVPRVSHDPDDDIVLATAVQGKSDVLCTRDRHLTHADVQSYAALHALRVLTDTQLLAELRAENGGDPPEESRET